MHTCSCHTALVNSHSRTPTFINMNITPHRLDMLANIWRHKGFLPSITFRIFKFI